MFKTISTKVSVMLVGVLGAGLITVGAPAPAEASHYSWIYNQKGSYAKLWPFPVTNKEEKFGRVKYRKKLPNNSKFVMECWTSFKYSYTGNYPSKKWFAGRAWNGGWWGYVHSSYVYYQKKVPRCR